MFSNPSKYKILVGGKSTESLEKIMDQLEIQLYANHDSTDIVLTGWMPDQSALMGVLQTLHELHYPIISVNSIK